MVCDNRVRTVMQRVGKHYIIIFYTPLFADEAQYAAYNLVEKVKEKDDEFRGPELMEALVKIDAGDLSETSAESLVEQLEDCLGQGEVGMYQAEVLKEAIVNRLMKNGHREMWAQRGVNAMVRLFEKMDSLGSELSHQPVRLRVIGAKYQKIKQKLLSFMK